MLNLNWNIDVFDNCFGAKNNSNEDILYPYQYTFTNVKA